MNLSSSNFSLTLAPGEKWSARIGRHRLLRFTTQGAGANLALLLFNGRDLGERLNLPDSLKAQHTAKLTQGHVLYSEMGRVLASITLDTTGWNDAFGGLTHQDQTDLKYGLTRFQENRNERLACGYHNVLTEMGKYGLTKKDLVPNVNLFSRVWPEDNGVLHYDVDHCEALAEVHLRTEMEVLLVVSNTPHPLDPRTSYPAVPIQLEISKTSPAAEDDFCRTFCLENRRGFDNNQLYHYLLD